MATDGLPPRFPTPPPVMHTTPSGVHCGAVSSSRLSSYRSGLNPTAQPFTPANLAASMLHRGPPHGTKADTTTDDDDSKIPDISHLTTENTDTATFQRPNSSLLSLPAELRNRIYSFTLISTKSIKIRTHSDAADGPKHVEPGLLRTCRQVREECLKMYYQFNTFSLKCQVIVVPDLKELESKLHMMRMIRIYVDGLCSHDSRYFRLDLSDGACHELVLIKHSGDIWEKGKHRICGKAALLNPAREYLKGCMESEMDGLTVETLQRLLEILAKCDTT